MNVPESIIHFSDFDVPHKNSRKEIPTEETNPGCFRRDCPGVIAARKEICCLMERLEKAENQMLNAAHIIQHLSTMDNLTEKLAAMAPYPHYSEGEEVRQHLWDMEKRISILQSYYNRLSHRQTLVDSKLRDRLASIAGQAVDASTTTRPSSSANRHSMQDRKPVISIMESVVEKVFDMVKTSGSKRGESTVRMRGGKDSIDKVEDEKEWPPLNKPSGGSNRGSNISKPSKGESLGSSKPESVTNNRGTIASITDAVVDKVNDLVTLGSPSAETLVSTKLNLPFDLEIILSGGGEKEGKSASSFREPIGWRFSPTRIILGGDISVKEFLLNIRENISNARDKFCQTRRTMYQLSKLLIHVKDSVALDSLCHCSKEVDNMKSALNALTGGQFESGGKVDFVHNKRLKESEDLLKDFDLRMRKIGSIKTRIDVFHKHVNELENNLLILFGRLDAGLPLRSGVNDNPTKINDLFNTIRHLEQNVNDVSKVPIQLKESEIQRDAAVDAIEEYVELLGIIKLDKADLLDAIHEKVPSELLRKKVHRVELSTKRSGFHAVIDHNVDLFESRNEVRERVAKGVQDFLDTKISLKELLKFEKFLNKKFRLLVDEIEMTPEVRHLVLASGSRKMLSDARLCCQCAAQLQDVCPPRPRGGLTPFHAYELRALHKKQLRLYGLKNMKHPENTFPLHWEKALEKQGPQRKKRRNRLERFCGGTYTETTPEQRHIRRIPCDELPICHYAEIRQMERDELQEHLKYDLERKLEARLIQHDLEKGLQEALLNKLTENIGQDSSQQNLPDELKQNLMKNVEEKVGKDPEQQNLSNELKQDLVQKVEEQIH